MTDSLDRYYRSLEGGDEVEGSFGASVLDRFHLVNWDELWKRESKEEWVAYPLVPLGRSVAFPAPGKSGKSLLLLDMVACLATGRPIFGRTNSNPPRTVLYLDYEMVEDDLLSRLEDMGYGPDVDFSRLRYSLLPTIDPLDTQAGGEQVLAACRALGAEVVVLDTMARAVSGSEDAADTFRAFYMHTAAKLKAAGITMIRLDHTGHSTADRARGSSAKADDVDVVWTLARKDNGLELKRTHSRIGWGPTRAAFSIETEPVLRHVLRGGPSWSEGTKETADLLDELGAPLDITKAAALRLLQDNKVGKRGAVVGDAVRFRRERS